MRRTVRKQLKLTNLRIYIGQCIIWLEYISYVISKENIKISQKP